MTTALRIKSAAIIPPYLVGDIQSKLGYIDEAILQGKVATTGDVIDLTIESSPDDKLKARIEEKVKE